MPTIDKKPLIIAGPCSAESEDQILATAAALDAKQISFFRAGLWKPRTSPHSFQGVGAKGIQWLLKAREQYGFKIATEVATPEHISQCRDANFDALWIGARTVSDPFAVQTISEYLLGYEGWVIVKNPISDDVDLWEGAIQRLQMMGIKRIIAVQRGIKPSTYHPTEMRNNPAWHMAIELRQRLANIPILCDPSHIAGKAEWVGKISQQAMSIGLDGLMVEVHSNPQKALSDSQQQLTPTQFEQLLTTISLRRQSTAEDSLIQLREQIDDIDTRLWQLIEQRMQVSEQIGTIKRNNGIPILQSKRYKSILEKRQIWAKEHGIDPQLVSQIMQALHNASVEQQL